MKRGSRGRAINGVFLLDKPLGITSNAALQKVKRLFQAQKAGHTGSLDPLASGMLPICLGEATKFSSFLLDADKHYLATCKLGVTTTTADAEGEVVETRPVIPLDQQRLAAIVTRFSGEIEQVPPMHSALKRQGVPLYKLAHQGIEIERQPRAVTIHEIRVTGYKGDELRLSVHCSKGTYLRTLAQDIGEFLGCGAHLGALRRTWVGQYRGEAMHTLGELESLAEQGLEGMDAMLLPMDSALAGWPLAELTADAAHYLRHGQPVFVPRGPTAGWVRLYAPGGEFIGVGEVQNDGKIAPRRLVNVK